MNKNKYAVHSRLIAARLRQVRTGTGLNGEAVAQRLGWSPSKVSRIELCRTGISLRDLRDLLDAYGVSGPEREALDQLAERIRGRELDDYSEAVTALEWTVTALPVSVRTPAYARGVLRAAQPVSRMTPRDVEDAVWQTAVQQARLSDDDNPMTLRLCLDEAVLNRRYGDRTVMAAQLRRLHELGTQPNIGLRILPLGVEACGRPSFSLFHFSTEPGEMPALSVEHAASTWAASTDDEIYVYQLAFEHLWKLALPEARTLNAIGKLCARGGI